MSSFLSVDGTAFDRIDETIFKLVNSGEFEKIRRAFPDLVEKIISLSNTSMSDDVNEVLQELNMVELELDTERMNAIYLSAMNEYDSMVADDLRADNKGVLGYDDSPEVVARGTQWQNDQHTRFLETLR